MASMVILLTETQDSSEDIGGFCERVRCGAIALGGFADLKHLAWGSPR